MDWGEAVVVIAGVTVTVQLFYHAAVLFAALVRDGLSGPEAGGLLRRPRAGVQLFWWRTHRISYDNLATAVQKVLRGKNRREQEAFVVFRSHYLFESHFCTPGEGHRERRRGARGGVWAAQLPGAHPAGRLLRRVEQHLLAQCQADDVRQVAGQPLPIGAAWALEQPRCCRCRRKDSAAASPNRSA